MVDEKRLRLMISLARYKDKNKDGAFRINRTYRSDYVGSALIRNFLLTTIAYLLLLLLIAISNSEYILAHLNELNIRPMIGLMVLGYLVLLGIYSVITLTMSRIRYSRAENSIDLYTRQLDKLKKMYRDEDQNEQEEKAIRAFEEVH